MSSELDQLTYVKGLCIEKPYLLVLGSTVSWYHHKLGRKTGVVGQELTRRGPARIDQKKCFQGVGRKGGHVEDVVVVQEEEVVGVVEAIDVVHLVLQELPVSVKLVDSQRWFARSHTRLQTNAH